MKLPTIRRVQLWIFWPYIFFLTLYFTYTLALFSIMQVRSFQDLYCAWGKLHRIGEIWYCVLRKVYTLPRKMVFFKYDKLELKSLENVGTWVQWKNLVIIFICLNDFYLLEMERKSKRKKHIQVQIVLWLEIKLQEIFQHEVRIVTRVLEFDNSKIELLHVN